MTEQLPASKTENQFIGKRITIRSFDWQRQFVGVLIKVEKYCFVLKQDSGAIVMVLKHSTGAIGLASAKEDAT